MDLEDLAEQLDADFAGLNNRLTPQERATIKAWQRTDREYRAIQELLRTRKIVDSRAEQQAIQLATLIRAGDTKRPLTVWRGIRSVHNTYQGGINPGVRRRFQGLTSVTLNYHIALNEFTKPTGPGGPALLRIELPTGTPALWVAGAGHPRKRRQYELLLANRTLYTINSINYAEHESIPVLGIEVHHG